MKALITILTLIISNQVLANSSCFANEDVQTLIKFSKSIDHCFSSDINNCDYSSKTVEAQKKRNSIRLVPYDREARQDEIYGAGFMNNATGIVSVPAANKDGKAISLIASAAKITSCHVITSAHLLFKDGKMPNVNNIRVGFHSGQSCDDDKQFKKNVGGTLVFKMMNKGSDFTCQGMDQYGDCEQRLIDGHSDLVIIKLDKGTYSKGDKNHFTLNTKSPSSQVVGQRVHCWGYPGVSENSPLPAAIFKKLLWHQKDAQIFGDQNGTSNLGIATNAIAYKGMSGGGCSVPTNPRELVGLFANNNSIDGKSAIKINPELPVKQDANYLAGFQRLEQRYNAENALTGKTLATLENECE